MFQMFRYWLCFVGFLIFVGPLPAWSASLQFNNGNFVQVVDSPTLDITGAITLEAWVYKTWNGEDWNIIFSKPWTSDNSPWHVYRLGLTSIGNVPKNAVCSLALEGGEAGVAGTSIIPDNVWTHLACTYDGSQLALYVNGTLEGTEPASGAIVTNDQPLVIGRNLLNTWNDWFGRIDEVRVWNVARTPAEIKAAMGARLTGGEPGLAASWSFEDASVTTADGSPNGNDGTMIGTPVWVDDVFVAQTPAPPGMTHWWGGDNNALDIVGNDDGTLIGNTTYTTGRVGETFSFDGSGGYVQMTDPATGDFGAGPFSVDFWMKANGMAGTHYLVGKSHPNNGEGWDMRLNDSRIQLVGVNGWPANHNFQTEQIITTNQWYHVAMVSDGATVELYVNGTLTGSIPRQAISTAANPFRIGFTTSYGGAGFNGLIDEVELFNRPLTSDEVTAIYQAGSLGKERSCAPPLADSVSWWRGENNGADSLGSNHAALVNGATFAAGRVGRSFSLDGSNDFVQVQNPVGLPLGGAARTMDLWFRTPKNLAAVQEGALVQYGSTGGAQMFGLIFSGNCAGKLYFYGHGSDLCGTTTVQPDTWYHGAVTYDGTTVSLYLNGRLENSGSMALNTVLDANGLTIGNRPGSNVWQGELDEVRIHSRALGTSEIAAIYNARDTGMCGACGEQPAGMVHWWGGDGNAADMIGTDDGSLVGGATYAAGKVGKAFSFNGTSGYVNLPPSSSAALTNEAGSLTAWVKPSTVGDNDMIVVFGSGGNGEGVGLGIFGEVRIYHHTGTYDWQTSTPVTAGEWTFLAYTWDGTTERLYKNGVFSESRPRNFSYVPGNGRIGHGWWGDSANYFPGLIDEVQAFNRTLTAEEVQALFNSGAEGICRTCAARPDGMVSWWQAEGNAADYTGNNNGAVQGSATYAAGMVGQSFSFDGVTSDFVSIPASASLSPTGVFSVGGWFYIDPTANNKEISCLVSKWDAGYAPGWGLDIGYGTNLRMSVRSTAGVHADAHLNGAITAPAWYHIVGVFDPLATPQIKLYLDGRQVASSSVVVDDAGANAFDARIGACNWTEVYAAGNDRLNGRADEVEFVGRALSDQEIAALANARNSGQCTSIDTIPDAFAFTDQTGVSPGSVITSDSITVAGINYPAAIAITGCTGPGPCEYEINGDGSWLSTPGMVANGDTVAVRQTSSGTAATQTDLVLDIGGVSDTFSVTTVATYTVSATAGTGGSLDAGTPSPREVVPGGTVDFTFNADTGYHLTAISGCGITIENDTVTSRTVTTAPITGPCTVTATFAIDQFLVDAYAGAGGTVDGGVHSSQIVDSGSTAQFTFNADTGNHVASISGCGIDYANSANTETSRTETTGPITGECTINGTFAINSYTLTYTAGANGSISGTTPQTVNHGASGTPVTAEPDAGYHFVDWSDGSTANPRTDTNLTGDRTVTANFAIDQYTLTVTLAGAGQGTVTSSPAGIDCGGDCFETYAYNTGVTLTATAAEGSNFTGWTGGEDCEDGSVTLRSDLTCTATFSPHFPWLMFNHLFVTGPGR